jgi:pimeloyl-ACP methyl ester carboxylesterase
MTTQYFERQEGTLAYTDYGGDGDLVLMLPGIGALRSEYRALAPQLRDAGLHPVSVDLRGHGDSSVPWPRYDVPSVGSDVLALIDHLGGEPAHLIGTSFAAGAVVWAAVQCPGKVRSLVLIGPFARDVKMNPFIGAAFWLMMHNPWRVSLWKMYYRTLYPTHKPDDFETYLAQMRANMSEPGRFDANLALATSSRAPSGDRLSRVSVPTLVVMGTKDPDFPDPVAEANFLVAQTHGTLALIDGAGHYPQTEMPDIAGPRIVDFLKQAVS